MRRPQRLIAATIVIALSSALAGCGSMGNFDPTDLLDFLDTKKKLPGERKPVFPDGVPGLEQGVPKDLYKGSRQQQIDEQNAQATAAAAPPPQEPKSKGAKSKGKQAPAAVSAAPADRPPPIPMPRPRKKAALPRHRLRRRPRRSCASAPPRRRPTSRPRPRHPRNNPPHRSRPRCRAVRSRVKHTFSSEVAAGSRKENASE